MSNYAYTLQVPAFKKIKGVAFGKMPSKMQIEYLTIVIEKVIRDEFLKPVDYIFEQHMDGRYHVHGTIQNMSFLEYEPLNRAICREIGLRPTQGAFMCVPIFDNLGWDTYKHKHIILDELENDLKKLGNN